MRERKCYLRSLKGMLEVCPHCIPGSLLQGKEQIGQLSRAPKFVSYWKPGCKRGQHPTGMGRGYLGLSLLSGPEAV